jgi:DNA-binding response OmpR family regulator
MSQNVDGAGGFFYVLQDALRILFVDDDPILREFAQVHLTTESAEVLVAQDGQEALEVLREVQPDIVLLDLEMPRMDGFQALTRLRADPAHARTPVIVVTGREDVAAIDRAFQAGATSFVAKPLNWRLISYQIRYVHRACLTEQSLRAEVDAATAALGDLCAAGSRFLAGALGVAPQVKAHAAPYLEALEEAHRRAPVREAG